MIVNDFYEIVEIRRKRQGKTLGYLAKVIGNKSIPYTRQVINGTQQGKKAEEYRRIIAEDLGIILVENK